MDTGLFQVSEAFLLAIMRLKDKNDPDFSIIHNQIELVSNSLTEIGLHSFPDFKVNYSERLNFTRGFAAALDVLKNIFIDPEHLVNEFREQEEMSKAMQQGMISDEGGEENEN